MNELLIKEIPYRLEWINTPSSWKVDHDGNLTIHAGEITDWFVDPAGNYVKDDSPCVVFAPNDENFLLYARVRVDFDSAYDAGGLIIFIRKDRWAKVCFEFSKQREPMIVSVVTQGLSDDCVSEQINGNEIYLRLAHTPKVTAFHYSHDGSYWTLVRYFSMGALDEIKVGFLAQSPTGRGCSVNFSEIIYTPKGLDDYRNGE